MTSRAGQALIDGEWVPHGRASRIAEAVAAIEQEVRDDIRARVEAALPEANTEDLSGGTFFWGNRAGWNAARQAVLAAISSSSATETQDGERPGLRCTACHQPEGHDYHKRRGRRWDVPYHPFYAPTPDDRDRMECPLCGGFGYLVNQTALVEAAEREGYRLRAVVPENEQ